MLTIFSIPKVFKDHISVIQRNAITSWTLLRPRPEIVLFGDETGTADIVAELDLRHNPDVARNEFGTPLLNDLFEKAQADPRADLLCYANADIILLQDFLEAVERTREWAKRFLMVGQCWDTEIRQPLRFDRLNWEGDLRNTVRSIAKRRNVTGIDYFVFPAGLYSSLPPFGLGRPFWDNWFLWQSCRSGIAVVDATAVTTVVHQNHLSSWTWTGPESERNLELAGGWHTRYSIANSRYRLTPGEIVRDWVRPLRARWELRRWIWTSKLINWTRPVRHAFGLNQRRLNSIKKVFSRS